MRRAATLLLLAAALSACGSGLYEFDTAPDTAEPCRAVIAKVPDRVGGQDRTPVDSKRVAAWGDPRIVLRCGVTRPAALEPTSECADVNGIGWFAEAHDGSTRFTTVGRDPDVSVDVPEDYEPAADALADLADVVRSTTRSVKPCV